MGETPKPTTKHHGEAEAFLSPPGQPDSLIDQLAAAQGWLSNHEPRHLKIRLDLLMMIVLSGGRT